MPALDEFVSLRSRKGPACWYRYLQVPAEDKAALGEALTTPTVTNKAIVLWLQRRGVQIALHQIARHRRGDCACVPA